MSETETKTKTESADKEETAAETQRKRTESEGTESNPDIHFDPIIQLPLIDLKTFEENETELLKLRAKLYRYDTSEETAQFKERGTGEVKLMRHNEIRAVRILMRRDKTLKLCANHYIMPGMELKNHSNSDKVFVWSTYADLSDPDEPPKPETLAIRFGSVENATKFKEAFEEALKFVEEANDLSRDISKLDIKDKNEENSESETESDDNNENKEDNNETKNDTKETNEEKKEEK